MAVSARAVLERMATAIQAVALPAAYTGGPTAYVRHTVPVEGWPEVPSLGSADRYYGLQRVRSLTEPMVASRPAGAYTRTEVDLYWLRVLGSGPTDDPSAEEADALDDEAALLWAVVSSASRVGGATWSVLEAVHTVQPLADGGWLLRGRLRFVCQHQAT